MHPIERLELAVQEAGLVATVEYSDVAGEITVTFPDGSQLDLGGHYAEGTAMPTLVDEIKRHQSA